MHRPTALLALLQCTAMIACHLKSEVPKWRRSIIEVPTFVGGRFASQEQRRSVVGYDGQWRRMFEEAADDDDCSSTCYSSQPAVRLPPDRPEKLQCASAINNDVWWLAVIENTNKNNEQLQHEMNTKEAWRKFQWVLSYSQ